jgi:4-hydroxy-3-methylbut-2-enyl diphosphate reductase
MAPDCDLVLVVGSVNSSNSRRLVDVALRAGAQAAFLIDYAHQIEPAWPDGVATIGVTSGASVPEVLVTDVLAWLTDRGWDDIEEVKTTTETQTFALPRELPAGGSTR